MAVAVGSSIQVRLASFCTPYITLTPFLLPRLCTYAYQIALFVIPVLVLLGWCIGQPLTFCTSSPFSPRVLLTFSLPSDFDELETVILFLSIIAVAFATSDGKTNWLEGFRCV
jgi:Ca2+/H+ antiporter